MAKRKVDNRKVEALYENFREALERRTGKQIFLLKIPVDRLNVKLSNGDVKSLHILQVIEAKYGLGLDDLRSMGWSTGRGPFPRTFYLIPPSKAGKGTKTTNKETDLAL